MDVKGEYICMIKWGQIIIRSSPSSLTVRTISVPPVSTNVVKGGAGELTCEAAGDTAASISFHRSANDESLGTAEVRKETDASGMVRSVGVLTIGADVTVSDDSISFYCKATWDGREVKSDNVYLSVLDITEYTETAWGIAGDATGII